MTTKMHNPETGETVRVPGRRVKDHLQNGFEIADGSEVPIGNVHPETGEDKVTKEELYERAQELDVEGRSKMTKEELEKALEEAEDHIEAETGVAPVVESGSSATSTNAETRAEHGTL